MDKQRVTAHITDDELRIKMYRVVDLCNNTLKNHEENYTEFMNPFEIKNAVSIVNSDSDLKYKIDGGYSDYIRAIVEVFPYYFESEDIESKLRFLEIKGNFKFTSVSHRDYLGSLLGLGIKREKIGDILVHENSCQIIVDSEICEFILYNYDKVGNNKVIVQEISREDLIIPAQEFTQKSISVSSLRLDNIIAGVFNLSRSEAIKYIDSEFVYVNYEKISQPSKLIEENSIISVRRKGKFIISEIGGTSKKGKTRLMIHMYK